MNTAIFLALNAGASPNAAVLACALFFSKYVPYLLMGLYVLIFISGNEKTRFTLFAIGVIASVAAVISWLIGHYAYMPRPFVIPIGHTLLAHKDNASFPSNHMLFMTILATTFLLAHSKKIGLVLAVLALAVGWSRIYLGLHFPQDIAGGALLGILVSVMIWTLLQPSKDRFLKFFSQWPWPAIRSRSLK
jgi:undecaprenyl-diphosphatase